MTGLDLGDATTERRLLAKRCEIDLGVMVVTRANVDLWLRRAVALEQPLCHLGHLRAQLPREVAT
jgi:hypothetical protein